MQFILCCPGEEGFMASSLCHSLVRHTNVEL